MILRVSTTCVLLASALLFTSPARAADAPPSGQGSTAAPSAPAAQQESSPRAAPPPVAPTAPTSPAPSVEPVQPVGPATLAPSGPMTTTNVEPPLTPMAQPHPPAPAAKTAMPVEAMRPTIRVTTWDLNLDAAYGQVFDTPENRPSWFMRARGGVLHVRDDWFYTAGVTYDLVKVFRVGGYDATNLGLQFEAMHIQYGVWGQVGGLMDFTGHGGIAVAAGWSLFGVEYQARTYEDLGPVQAFYGKIRIPVSIIYHAVVKKDL